MSPDGKSPVLRPANNCEVYFIVVERDKVLEIKNIKKTTESAKVPEDCKNENFL